MSYPSSSLAENSLASLANVEDLPDRALTSSVVPYSAGDKRKRTRSDPPSPMEVTEEEAGALVGSSDMTTVPQASISAANDPGPVARSRQAMQAALSSGGPFNFQQMKKLTQNHINAIDEQEALDNPTTLAQEESSKLLMRVDPCRAKEDSSLAPASSKRKKYEQRAPPRPCIFGLIHGTQAPCMVGSLVNDTPDWQIALNISADPPGLTLLVRQANIPKRAPINHNLKDHLEFSLQWLVPDADSKQEVLIHWLESHSFEDWYTRTTPAARGLPINQKLKSDTKTKDRPLTVIECNLGALPSFKDFPDLKVWQRLPDEVRSELEKARAGRDIITFVVEGKPAVNRNLEALEKLVPGSPGRYSEYLRFTRVDEQAKYF
ncbi:MAG: hypothetical protein Q9226_004825 [Calogaya cf. arnoldii]